MTSKSKTLNWREQLQWNPKDVTSGRDSDALDKVCMLPSSVRCNNVFFPNGVFFFFLLPLKNETESMVSRKQPRPFQLQSRPSGPTMSSTAWSFIYIISFLSYRIIPFFLKKETKDIFIFNAFSFLTSKSHTRISVFTTPPHFTPSFRVP